MTNENVEIEVLYNVVTYSITYKGLEGATNNPNNPMAYTYDSAEIRIEAPTKPGYTFVGWKETEEGQAVSRPVISKNSSGDKVYIAVWSVNNHLVNYVSEHGVIETVHSAKYGETVEFDVTVDPGYEISDIRINGVSVPLDTREFVMIDSDNLIEVDYSIV
jgi:uncharacterized repeat protein (TIGR02543 family)